MLVVGAVHLQQYLAAGFGSVRVIGTLFLLNFAGATVIGLGLLVPAARLRVLHVLLALLRRRTGRDVVRSSVRQRAHVGARGISGRSSTRCPLSEG
ncbi:MAG TPA: hypothetical protein VGH46_04735 [Gaiellaceae bacterium]